MGKEIPLKLGYVGIKNRSQKDIQEKMRVSVALKMEEEYFASHPVYSSIPKEYLGSKALISKLTTILFQHIRHCLP